MSEPVVKRPRQPRCSRHNLVRRCPACESEHKPDLHFPELVVPRGTAEWLREAAKHFASMGDEGAVAFAEWASVDLREVG